jgi:hypothetical protein
MTLDSRFIIASDLQSVFVDDTTGLLLASGKLRFWKDQARTVPKSVYTLTGTPPDYTYVNLGADINLSLAGTPTDNNGHDIILYYFTFEGMPDNSNSKPELYYVEGVNAAGQTIFTRQGWPNFMLDGDTAIHLDNLAPNGQFLIHNDVSATNTNNYTAGQITQPVTPIAQGGWTFERPTGSTSKDILTFTPFVSAINSPSANPKFALRIQCQAPSAGDSFKDIRLTYPDVNKFASATQKYTYAFSGQSNGGGSVNASIVLRKNFGTGGSAATEVVLANVTIPNGSYGIVQTPPFVFGTNIGKTIGTAGDDSVQLILRLPTDTLFDISVTNFELVEGAVTLIDFPATPNSQFQYEAMPPALPNYDGSSYYLPMQLTPNGFIYDDSSVGEVIAESNLSNYINSLHPTSNKMLADGSQYETAAFSPLGIPFSRLQARYWNSALGLPIYGTGKNYFLGVLVSSTNQFILANNSQGVVTTTVDGSAATGFTFSVVHTGIAAVTGYFCKAVQDREDGFLIINNEPGAVGVGSTGTAPIITSQVREGGSDFHAINAYAVTAGVVGGQYFTFQTSNAGVVNWYVWFQVDGAGVDPGVPGRIGILVNVHSGDSVVTIAQKITMALNAAQVTSIFTVAASALTGGDFFTANAITPEGTVVAYYVWYTKEGVGTDPKPSGRLGVKVAILSTDTAAQVAQKTQMAINQKYFSVPDYRGQFFRGWNNASDVDPNAAGRYSSVIGILGDVIGTQELDEMLSHAHQYTKVSTGTGEIATGTDTSLVFTSEPTTPFGDDETRPINIYVNYAIRY